MRKIVLIVLILLAAPVYGVRVSDDSTKLEGTFLLQSGAEVQQKGLLLLNLGEMDVWWSVEVPDTFGVYRRNSYQLLAEVPATRGHLRQFCSLIGRPLPNPRR